jgi:hypothetical protein
LFALRLTFLRMLDSQKLKVSLPDFCLSSYHSSVVKVPGMFSWDGAIKNRCLQFLPSAFADLLLHRLPLVIPTISCRLCCYRSRFRSISRLLRGRYFTAS